jgi:hypothetical protein
MLLTTQISCILNHCHECGFNSGYSSTPSLARSLIYLLNEWVPSCSGVILQKPYLGHRKLSYWVYDYTKCCWPTWSLTINSSSLCSTTMSQVPMYVSVFIKQQVYRSLTTYSSISTDKYFVMHWILYYNH